ncbi:hypothetical protein PIPA1_00230 [Pelosinus sp. IPA-1]|nr:hypothetical protein PIPA1_00230 [Pelosinus sp. IPA-1]
MNKIEELKKKPIGKLLVQYSVPAVLLTVFIYELVSEILYLLEFRRVNIT